MGEGCPFRAGVGINGHFDSYRMIEHVTSYYFGFYDLVLGLGLKAIALPATL